MYGLILMGLTTSLDKMRLSKRKIELTATIFLCTFIFLTGFTPSVIRASIMAGLGILASLVHRKSNMLNNLSFSLLITLICNPYNIYNTSVLLSYGGVIRYNIFFRTNKKHS